jgi:hypothetical protein
MGTYVFFFRENLIFRLCRHYISLDSGLTTNLGFQFHYSIRKNHLKGDLFL